MGGQKSHQRNKAHKRGRFAKRSNHHKHHKHQHTHNPTSGGVQKRSGSVKQQKKQKQIQGDTHNVPKIVALLPLTLNSPVAQVLHSLGASVDDAAMLDQNEGSGVVKPMVVPGNAKNEKLLLMPVPVQHGSASQCADVLKCADIVLDVARVGEICIDAPENLHCIKLFASVPAVCALAGLHELTLHQKSAAQKSARVMLSNNVQHGDARLLAFDNEKNAHELRRFLLNTKAYNPQWRAERPYVLAHGAQIEHGPDGSLRVAVDGYVRAHALCADQLVHVPDHGEFQLQRIELLNEPSCSIESSRKGRTPAASDEYMDHEPHCLFPHPETREPLQRENIIEETMEGANVAANDDKTWPTDEEIRTADAERKRLKQQMPKGTSEYQASWLLDQQLNMDSDADEDVDAPADEYENTWPQATHNIQLMDEDDDDKRTEAATTTGTHDTELDNFDDEAQEREKAHAENERRKREREAMEDAEFPDEVEAPEDQPARQRFSRYRALQSFRTTPWNPQADLPDEFNRIFSFDSLRRAQKQAHEKQNERAQQPNTASVGKFVRLVLDNVPVDTANILMSRTAPLIVLGLLIHEAKLTVNSYRLTLFEPDAHGKGANGDSGEEECEKAKQAQYALRSKDPIVIEAGFRRHTVWPIYSHDGGGDKHKFLRYLYPGVPAVASFYGPIIYPHAPGLVYTRQGTAAMSNSEPMKDESHGAPVSEELVGVGRIAGPDPLRVNVKRIILTGIPVKVLKRKATVRHMFHSPDDVRYFKPVDLFTKHGKRGSIKEPIGTHGAMKCRFNAPVHQHDTVCLSLYKRVFPRYSPR